MVIVPTTVLISVSLTLSTHDVRRLQAALSAFLSPLDHPSTESWLGEVSQRASELLGADQALGMVPRPTPGSAIMAGAGYDVAGAVSDYERDFMQADVGVHGLRQALGIEVYHQWHLYEPAALHKHFLYNDWCLPHRLLDVIGMGYNPMPGKPVACLHFYHDQDHGPEDSECEGAFGRRGRLLLELLLPAWKAGVRQHLTLGACREEIGRVFDRLEEGVAVFDAAGRERYRSSALANLVAADRQGAWLESIVRTTASRLCPSTGSRVSTTAPMSTSSLSRIISTATGRYTMETSLTRLPVFGSELTILVILRRMRPTPLTDRDLTRRYHLTSRECETARLIASGLSNTEIAAALKVTGHTARRHTEAILRKLGKASRAAVAAMLGNLASSKF